MKKVLLKFFALITLCLSIKTYYIFKNNNDLFIGYTIQQKSQKNLIDLHKNRYIDTIILGDSLASFNIAASKINGNALNLSLYGATFIENYFTLKRYLEDNSAPKKIILSNSWNWDYKMSEEFWIHFVRNGFYSDDEIQDIFNGVNSPFFLATKYYLYRAQLLGISTYQLQRSFKNRDIIRGNNLIVHTLFMSHKGSTNYKLPFPGRDMWQNYHKEYGQSFYPNELNTRYLKELIHMAKKNNIEIHFFEEPVIEEYQNDFKNSKFNTSYKNFLLSLVDHSTFFLHKTEEINLIDEDFFDATHLIESGAYKYTKYINDILASQQIMGMK